MELAFHRGTVVLRADPAPSWVAELPGILWDPRTRCHRATARRYPELVAALRARGVRFIDRIRPGRRTPPDGRPDTVSGSGGPPLRPYQETALLAWSLAGCRGVVALPTGAGKTRVGIAAIHRLRASTLVLVPTRVLLQQWLLRLEQSGLRDVGCYGDGCRRLGPVTVATFESGWRWMDRIGHRFDLLIVDEVHHFGRGARDEVLDMSVAHARLGLTATPPDDEAAVGLMTLVGPVVHRLGVEDLVGRYLAPYDRFTLTLQLTPEERGRYERLMATFRDVHRAYRLQCPEGSWVDFVATVGRHQEGRAGLRALRRAKEMLSWTEAKQRVVASLLERHRQDRTLLFTTDNAAAYAIARDHLVMPITCDIGRKERDEALARFRDGSLMALVSSRVLNEGIDVPAAEVGIVVGGAQGVREHVQRIGRLLRPGPGKRATVYELAMAETSEMRKVEMRSQGLAAGSAAAV